MIAPAEIKVHYENMARMQGWAREKARKAQLMHQRLSDHLRTLRAGAWVSPASDKCYREIEDILAGIDRFSRALTRMDETLALIITKFQEAERAGSDGIEAIPMDGVVVLTSKQGASSTADKSSGDSSGSRSPKASVQADADIPATDEQLEALEALGVTVSDPENLTSDEADRLLSALQNQARGEGILEEGEYTEAELQQAANIIEELEAVSLEFGQSSAYGNPSGWTLAELQQMEEVVSTMAGNATDTFLQTYSQADLTALAAYYGLPSHWTPG